MPKMKALKKPAALETLKGQFPPATADKPKAKSDQKGLMIQMPAETLTAIKVKAATEDSTVRAVVLEALAAAGHPVPEGELTDRRKRV